MAASSSSLRGTDRTGNPDAAVTPGVVNRKLSVPTNRSTPIALPMTDSRADGLRRRSPGSYGRSLPELLAVDTSATDTERLHIRDLARYDVARSMRQKGTPLGAWHASRHD